MIFSRSFISQKVYPERQKRISTPVATISDDLQEHNRLALVVFELQAKRRDKTLIGKNVSFFLPKH